MATPNSNGGQPAGASPNTAPGAVKSNHKPRATAAPEYNLGMSVMAGLDDAGGGESAEQKRQREDRERAEAEKQRKAQARGEGEGGQQGEGGDGDGNEGGDEGGRSRQAEGRGEGGADGRGADGGEGGGEGEGEGQRADGGEGEGQGAGEGEGQGGNEGEDGDADPHAAELAKLNAETKRFLAQQLKDLSPEQRAAVEKVIGMRLGKVVKQASAERERLEAQVVDMTGELEAAQRAKGAPAIEGIHPALLVDSEAEIDEMEDKNEAFLGGWAIQHRDGYNLPESENYDPSQPTYTAEQISQRVYEVTRENRRILPQARQALKERAAADAALRKVVPALFDAKSPEYRAAHLILRDQPWLKRFPDFRRRIAAQVLGQKALAELEKKSAAAAPAKGGGQDNQGTPKPGAFRKAPRLPGSGGVGGPAKGGSDGRRPAGSGTPEAIRNFGKEPSVRNLTSIVERMLS
jgi:hypothetical protein